MKSDLLPTILDKLEALPEALQQEVIDYIDFLLQKYQIEPTDQPQAAKKDDQSDQRQPQKLEFW
jgi:hypothetical protein